MNDLKYKSTRGGGKAVTASWAILQGIAEDGGLFVPERLPAPGWDFDQLSKLDYQSLAYEVIRHFLTDYTEEELKSCIAKAYDDKFDTKEIVPLRQAGDAFYLELYHGATAAFKDMALSLLPHLMVTAAKKNNIKEDIVILTATSGDTGKAALAGFAGVPGTKIIVFYPKYGVSAIQERQMLTQSESNTCVIGVRGNFDDCQTGVKNIFTDREFNQLLSENSYRFSSANSINIGRLIPQVVYYVWAYCRLLEQREIRTGEQINVTVPTGNFGNILAAYYAKGMGLPIKKLICASNDNKVLYDFFQTGTYDRNRDFILTDSPSMDILISSNLERLIYTITGEDAETNTKLMRELSAGGSYTINPKMKEGLSDFIGGYATGNEASQSIHKLFTMEHYCIDTHTAVAAAVYEKYVQQTGDSLCTVIASTASPYKFTRSVLKALTPEVENSREADDFILAETLQTLTGTRIPEAIAAIRRAAISHDKVCGIGEMKENVVNYLNIPTK